MSYVSEAGREQHVRRDEGDVCTAPAVGESQLDEGAAFAISAAATGLEVTNETPNEMLRFMVT